jgi:hypothetical protein
MAGTPERTDLPAWLPPEDDETPIVLFYCPACAEREFGDYRGLADGV